MVKEGRLGLYPAVGNNCCILRSRHDGQQRLLQRSFLYCFRLTSPHVSRHLFFKCPLSFLLYFVPIYPQMLIVLSFMTLCTMMSVRAMPVHGHCRPNQPDDVLTFSKNHLCVYKELPLLHNSLMHIPASAWIFGSKFCTFCFDVIGAEPSSGQASTWAFF